MADIIGKIKGKLDEGLATLDKSLSKANVRSRLDEGLAKVDKSLSRVNVKSKELIGKQKIRLHLSELKAERKIAYQKLGRMTYDIVNASGAGTLGSGGGTKGGSGTGAEIRDKWDESVLEVLGSVAGGKLKDSLFEETKKELKITAKNLSDEVEKLLPDSEKKGQNLQWLGRVLGKFDLPDRKYSKRIDGERETVYVFDKKKLASLMDAAAEGKKRRNSDSAPADMSNIEKVCGEIAALDAKIAGLEEELNKTA